MKNKCVEKALFALIFLLIGGCLGVFVTPFIFESNKYEHEIEEIEQVPEVSALRNPLINRISFSASGEVIELEENQITIKESGKILVLTIEEQTQFLSFSLIENEETQSTKPELISLNDIQIGENVGIFGREESSSSLIAETITVSK